MVKGVHLTGGTVKGSSDPFRCQPLSYCGFSLEAVVSSVPCNWSGGPVTIWCRLPSTFTETHVCIQCESCISEMCGVGVVWTWGVSPRGLSCSSR